MRRRKSSSGETLVETLAALLLVVLSGLLFLQMTMASTRMSAQSKALDQRYQQILAAAEEEKNEVSESVAERQGFNSSIDIGGHSYPVKYFVHPDAAPDEQLFSYSASSDDSMLEDDG